MGLELNQNCKERLITKLIEVLPSIVVEKNYFIKWTAKYYLNKLEIILPQKGSVKDKLDKYIGDTPFSEFVFEFLSQKLKASSKYKADEIDKLLISLSSFSNISTLAEEIVELFDSLPWEYSISMPLYNEICEILIKEKKEYSLSDNVKLIIPDDAFIKKYPFRTREGKEGIIYEKSKGILSMLLSKPLEWDNNKVYLNFIIEGFIRENGYTSTYENLIENIKAFFGLGIALRLYKINYEYHQEIENISLIIHRNTNENWNFEETITLEDDISERFIDLSLNDLDGSLDTEPKKIAWIKGALFKIGIVFSATQRAERIILATKWFFESYIGTNELLSFIQCNVALEILLGDKAKSDLIGLGELLGNRCAYLIGKSSKQREGILKDFKQIYNIRSSIVHSGKSKLTQTERYAFNKLQWMCRRVIVEEIELLIGDLDKN